MACRSDRPRLPEAQVKGDGILKHRGSVPPTPTPSDPPGSQIPFPSSYKYSSCKRREGRAHQFGWQIPGGGREGSSCCGRGVVAPRRLAGLIKFQDTTVPQSCPSSTQNSPASKSPSWERLPPHPLPWSCLRSSSVNAIISSTSQLDSQVAEGWENYPGRRALSPLHSPGVYPACRGTGPAESSH